MQEIKLRSKQRAKEIISIGDKNKVQAVTGSNREKYKHRFFNTHLAGA